MATKNSAGLTPLHIVKTKEIAKLLIAKGADVNAVNKYGDNSLMHASNNCHSNIAKLLINNGADVNAVSQEGHTALMFANAEISKLLIDAAVAGAMISKYRNAGQTCVCANRIYVQESVYEEFSKKLAAATEALKVGNGFDEGVTTGPLIDMQGLEKVEEHIEDAVSKGASVIAGGNRSKLGGTFFTPTVLTNVNSSMKVAREETFGPIAPLFSFNSDKDVIEAANDTEFGLAAYFYARDLSRVWRVAEALEYGIVGINTGIISTEIAPFGGIKQSGLGREGSKYGIDDFLEIKYLCMSEI